MLQSILYIVADDGVGTTLRHERINRPAVRSVDVMVRKTSERYA
jgi:hypothetical protein